MPSTHSIVITPATFDCQSIARDDEAGSAGIASASSEAEAASRLQVEFAHGPVLERSR